MDVPTTSDRHLRGKYAIVGVGETTYTRGSGRTTRALATWAVRNAIEDAGLRARDVDGMLSYAIADSVMSPDVGGDLGVRLSFYMDVWGGGSSTEALVGLAMGAIEAGMCHTYDYRPGGCRQVRGVEVTANLGLAIPQWTIDDSCAVTSPPYRFRPG